MIHAYDEAYLATAQDVLGHAIDYAVMTLEIEPNVFQMALSASHNAGQFARGNPRFVCGVNGCEFARLLLDEVGVAYPPREDAMYLDKSPEYWAGWAIAYYQWYTGYSFFDVFKVSSLDDVIDMYRLYHEMDIEQFVDQMNARMHVAGSSTRLQRHRLNCGLSQAGLAREAQVPIRQIQLFEQRQRDINKAAAATLLKLSRALFCSMEDLLELETL